MECESFLFASQPTMTSDAKPSPQACAAPRCEPETCTGGVRTLPSEALLRGERCVLIMHGGALYALRTTRAGKLILTK